MSNQTLSSDEKGKKAKVNESMSKEKLPSVLRLATDTLVTWNCRERKGRRLFPSEQRSRNECGDGRGGRKTVFGGEEKTGSGLQFEWKRGPDGTVRTVMHLARYFLQAAYYSSDVFGQGVDTRTHICTSRVSGTPDGTALFSGERAKIHLHLKGKAGAKRQASDEPRNAGGIEDTGETGRKN